MLTLTTLEARENPVLWNPAYYAADFHPIPGHDRSEPAVEIMGNFVTSSHPSGDGFEQAFMLKDNGAGGGKVYVYGDRDGDLNTPDWGLLRTVGDGFDSTWLGGVELTAAVRVGPLNLPGIAHAIVVYPVGFGAGPVVRSFTLDGAVNTTTYIFEESFRGGIAASVSDPSVDVNRDGTGDLLFTPGAGGGPAVAVVDVENGGVIEQFYIGPEDSRERHTIVYSYLNVDDSLELKVEFPDGVTRVLRIELSPASA